jgi:stage II sporulation protein D
MRRIRFFGALLATLLLAGGPQRASAAPPPDIRVLVIEAGSVQVDGISSPLTVAQSGVGHSEAWRPGMSFPIVAATTGLESRGLPLGTRIEITNSTHRYRVADRTFRGTLSVVWRERDKLQVISNLPMEDYLVGIIGSEISPAWPEESQKAQAVAARTYALQHVDAARRSGKGLAYDLSSTTLFQVYDGAHKEDGRARDAVAETRGQVLLRAGTLFPAYYHSCCGGRTEHAKNVWPGEAGPPTIADDYCVRSPKMFWNFAIPSAEFLGVLRANNIAVEHIEDIATEAEEDNLRVARVLLSDRGGIVPIKATELRRIFGYANIKSTWFDVRLSKGEVLFTGRGYGHGVGMCQWGAKGMAEAGKDYREILKFYYPDADISTAY